MKIIFYEFRSIFRTTHVKNALFLLILASTTLHPAGVWMHVPAEHVPSLSWVISEEKGNQGKLKPFPFGKSLTAKCKNELVSACPF